MRPSLPGAGFEVLNYDADMELIVREGHEVTIYGYEGEPYARILRDGTVQKNQRSPATYLNVDRYAEAQVPKSERDAKAPPLWKTVDGSGTLRWHDHRMHYMATGAPPQVKDESRPRSSTTKSRCGSTAARAIEGTLFWSVPPTPRQRYRAPEGADALPARGRDVHGCGQGQAERRAPLAID